MILHTIVKHVRDTPGRHGHGEVGPSRMLEPLPPWQVLLVSVSCPIRFTSVDCRTAAELLVASKSYTSLTVQRWRSRINSAGRLLSLTRSP